MPPSEGEYAPPSAAVALAAQAGVELLAVLAKPLRLHVRGRLRVGVKDRRALSAASGEPPPVPWSMRAMPRDQIDAVDETLAFVADGIAQARHPVLVVERLRVRRIRGHRGRRRRVDGVGAVRIYRRVARVGEALRGGAQLERRRGARAVVRDAQTQIAVDVVLLARRRKESKLARELRRARWRDRRGERQVEGADRDARIARVTRRQAALARSARFGAFTTE